jgi:hypothetical protein
MYSGAFHFCKLFFKSFSMRFLPILRRRFSTASEFGKHEALLASLELKYDNMGVFNGSWVKTDDKVFSVNPSTNKIIGIVRVGSCLLIL